MLSKEDRKVVLRFKKRLLDNGIPVIEMRIFGSRARGDAVPESDLDVFLLLNAITPEIKQTISDLAWECGFTADRIITTVEFTPEEVLRTPLRSSPFIRTVMQEGVVL
ncbi:MAG: nucleotidyltransferase domain-containing protein [Clostridia bacterium]|nr:nucleotidyltransferase domain-containing protein [Clostridia bacterium]